MKPLSIAVSVPFAAGATYVVAAAFAATGALTASKASAEATASIAAEAPEHLLKCDRRTDEPHYIVDGVFFEAGDAANAELARTKGVLSADSLHSLYITCWDPEARTLQKGTGEPVVHVTSKLFMDALHEDMHRIVAAQDAYYAQHGRFAGLIGDLEASIMTPGLEVTIATSDDGWRATGRGDLLIVSCSVFAGPIDPPSAALPAREPNCVPLPQFAD